MAIVWSRESAKDRGLSVKRDDGGSATRSFIVRVDDPSTALSAIMAEPGISIGDVHPTEVDLFCESIDVSAADDSGMLYEVSFDYTPNPEQEPEDPEDPGSDDRPGEIDGKIPSWSASSSVSSEPTFTDVDGNTITNSAGDPLEDIEVERAQFHLQLTQYYISHADNPPVVGWLGRIKQFTNAVNNDQWNGGAPGQWKCQGASAKLNVDRQGEGGAARVFWEVTWDFAYREDYWVLRPWDIGFNELVDENGDPAPTPYISGGDGGEDIGSGGSEDDGPCAGGLGRRAILGQDGKPVRQPVALEQGVAKAPCLRPNSLWFQVYRAEDFGPAFGEVFTPQP